MWCDIHTECSGQQSAFELIYEMSNSNHYIQILNKNVKLREASVAI